MNTTQCPNCAGTGTQRRLYQSGEVECRKCHGEGEVSN